MKVVSYYTKSGQYPALAERLRASCDRFDLNHFIAPMQAADWMVVCNQKPKFLRDMLMETRGPILWCDADCEILRMPSLFWKHGFDFAIYNWAADPACHEDVAYNPGTCNFSSGVVYLDYTAPVFELLAFWIEATARAKIVDDQVLNEVWNNRRPPVRNMWLPRQANWMTGPFGPPTEDVIIRHDFVNGSGKYRVGLMRKQPYAPLPAEEFSGRVQT